MQLLTALGDAGLEKNALSELRDALCNLWRKSGEAKGEAFPPETDEFCQLVDLIVSWPNLSQNGKQAVLRAVDQLISPVTP